MQTLDDEKFNSPEERDRYWMGLALAQAKKAAEINEVPVGAVVVKDNKLIAAAHNQCITLHDASAHAEVLAVREAGKVLANYRAVDCELYVTIEPCLMCAGALVHGRFKRLVYGASEPKAGVIYSQLQLMEKSFLNHHMEIESGVLAEECRELMSDFFKRRRLEKKRG